MDDLLIHVPLLNEGVDVSRPTEAMAFGDGYYKILPTPDYETSGEQWKFPPETIVNGEWRNEGSPEEALYAISKLELSPDEMEWLSFAEESEQDLWEIRKHLEEKSTQDALIGLLGKKLIELKKDGAMLTESESVKVVQFPQLSPEPTIELAIRAAGQLIYFQNPDIKSYFESKRKA